MRILAIETSCDETAISIIDVNKKTGGLKILANLVSSQVLIHKPFGGVVPNLARREHQNNLVPILIEALSKAGLLKSEKESLGLKNIRKILEREPELAKIFEEEIPKIKIPKIDAIAVTHGPGLAPALWVGVNFAKALSFAWKKPIIPVNHMEGHIFSSLIKEKSKNKFTIIKPKSPALALLVSGGHTEIVLVLKSGKYKVVGETIDDASGEAFDKVARILELPYPGGPEISKLAEKSKKTFAEIKLPRPMLNSKDFNFSFSGLKTAVLYLVRDLTIKKPLSEEIRAAVAKEFQNSVVEVLVTKTINAAKFYNAKTIILGGGVAANGMLRSELALKLKEKVKKSNLYLPELTHTGDNALMISVAAAINGKKKKSQFIKAESGLKL